MPGIGITVFYPHGKVSDIQYLQMATQEGRNVAVAAVEGNFDDVQSTVKKIFASDLRQELADEGVELSSANSINIGRLVPQVVYYFDAYRQLVEANEVEQAPRSTSASRRAISATCSRATMRTAWACPCATSSWRATPTTCSRTS